MAAATAVRERTHAALLLAALLAPFGLACCAPGGSGSSTAASDAVGAGGPMDEIYREIYHPGRGTGW